jgi:EAL domain-containing protein (putative c-di-GMP-specific phosphodiesterase class I)
MTGNLYFEMQPIMSTSRPFDALSFEVLVHMHDSQGNTIPTERFMTVAKTIGRMTAIDQWVLSNVLDWIRRNKERLTHVEHIFINLSGASLNDDAFVNGVVEVLGQYSDIIHWVCLEITEDVALKNLHHAKQFLTRLRAMGVKVALDDFGAGYTSFAYLRELPSDFLKIDGSLIAHINADPANAQVVQGIVNMAHSLNIKTVAEWAEDSASVKTLMDMGIHFIQGYAIARPSSPEALLRMPHSASQITDPHLLEWLERRNA